MYTLPLTCRNLLYIIVVVATLVGVVFTHIGMQLDGMNIYLFFGILILGVEGMLLVIVGIIQIVIWCDENVRCKCGK